MWRRGQTFAFGLQFGKVIYKGRLDAEMSACDPLFLTLLERNSLRARIPIPPNSQIPTALRVSVPRFAKLSEWF
jgi:hypothetical protein